MKKYISALLLILLIIPSVALASWWNPFSWKVFHRKEKAEIAIETKVLNTESIDKKTTEPINKPTDEIKKLQKQIDKLENSKENNSIDPNIEIQARKELESKSITDINLEIAKQKEIAEQLRQLQVQLDKAEQDRLVLKQKADEQLRINAAKIELEKQIAQQNEINRIKEINAQKEKDAELAIQQEIIQQAIQVKQEKLNAINKKIAGLNAKYAEDVIAARKRTVSMTSINRHVQVLTDQYNIDYAVLMAQFQQIKYSD